MRCRLSVIVLLGIVGCGADEKTAPPPDARSVAPPENRPVEAATVPRRPQLTPELKAKLTSGAQSAIAAKQYEKGLRDLAALRDLYGPPAAWAAFESSSAYTGDVGDRAWGVSQIAGLLVAGNRDSEQLVVEGLVRYARDEDAGVRTQAVRRLGELVADERISAAAAIPALIDIAAHDDGGSRQAAIRELGDLAGHKAYRTADLRGLEHPLRGTAAVETLLISLNDSDSGVRSAAARALGQVAANDLSLAGQMLEPLREKLAHEPADDTPRARSEAARLKASALTALENIVRGLEPWADELKDHPESEASRRFNAVQSALEPLLPIVAELKSEKDSSLRSASRRVEPKLQTLVAQ